MRSLSLPFISLVIRPTLGYVSEVQIMPGHNIRNDFTPEEEAQIIEENKWCEEV